MITAERCLELAEINETYIANVQSLAPSQQQQVPRWEDTAEALRALASRLLSEALTR